MIKLSQLISLSFNRKRGEGMKKLAALALALVMIAPSVYAIEGEMGYFGGASTGQKLPTITSLAQNSKKKTSRYSMPYKEVIYLTGKPVVVEGTIDITPGKVDTTKGQGKYTDTYRVTAESKDGKSKVTRNISFDTDFIYEPSLRQTTKTSKIKKWTENVTVEGNTYKLDPKQSSFSKSILEDDTPGVAYYRGDLQYEAVYEDITGDNGELLTVSVSGPIYGYEQAFAKTETQKRKITISKGEEQYYIEETPTYTVHKDIQYGANEPDAISFAGNYKELIRSEGSVGYNIIAGNPALYEDEKVGAVSVTDSPVIEQLSIPALPQIKGHPAESDIKKMYSMKIFNQSASSFSPSREVRRGDYIAMLVRAFQMPLPEVKKATTTTSTAKKNVEVSVFSDISLEDPLYPYMKAAYDAGLIGSGKINPNTRLTREEMYAINIRAMGLQRLGIATLGAYTPFIDDKQINASYKAEVYAASKIGLIDAANGYLFPKRNVTYAEAAAFLGKMIDYLRYDLQKDYSEKMMM